MLRGWNTVLPLLALIALAGCEAPAGACVPVPFSVLAANKLAVLAPSVDFGLEPPCVSRSGFEVTDVLEDELPGAQRRVHFVVQWQGQPAFTLSQTRALMLFSQIPQGTHRLRVDGERATAAGFAGPSGSGSEIAYLRWRTAEVTFELSATLHPWLAERDLVAVTKDLLRRPPAASGSAMSQSDSRRVNSVPPSSPM